MLVKSAIDVGRDVRVRVAHLVDELLRHRRHRDPAAGVGMLVDHERSVVVAFDDRIADVGEIGNRLPVVEAVAARALRAALDDVAGDDAGGEAVPVVGLPAELVAERRHRERRIGRPAGDDDVGALRERLDDRHGPDVGVRRQHAVADRRERLAGLHVRERMSRRDELVESRQEVVARDDADPHGLGDAVLLRDLANGGRARRRIHAAGIGDHAHASRRDGRQHALDRADEIARVPHLGIALLLLLQNAHRDFGEVVEHEVVDLPALHLAPRRLEPVAPESLSRRDADHASVRTVRAHASSKCAGRTNAPKCGPLF